MPSFTLFKSVHWPGLESWRGRFWTPNLMFDTPALDGFKAEAGRPYPVQHILWIQKDFIQWNALSCCSQLYGLQRVGGRWGEMVRCTVEHSSPPSLLKVNSRGSRKRPHRPLQCWIIDEIGGIEALCRLFPSSHLNPCSVTHACMHVHVCCTWSGNSYHSPVRSPQRQHAFTPQLASQYSCPPKPQLHHNMQSAHAHNLSEALTGLALLKSI